MAQRPCRFDPRLRPAAGQRFDPRLRQAAGQRFDPRLRQAAGQRFNPRLRPAAGQRFNPRLRRADGSGMDPERVLDVGERGIHLLFETSMISEAFGQDADQLRAEVDGRLPEIQAALQRVGELEPLAARRFVAELEAPLRHILILLYFDLLDGRLRRKPILH